LLFRFFCRGSSLHKTMEFETRQNWPLGLRPKPQRKTILQKKPAFKTGSPCELLFTAPAVTTIRGRFFDLPHQMPGPGGGFSPWPPEAAFVLPYPSPYAPSHLRCSLRERGPSNSQKKTPCQVPRQGWEFSTGMSRLGPNAEDLMCASLLPSMWR
jgi:hypothetical protein